MIITPTPGRVVWFYPGRGDKLRDKHSDPFAALVSFVHSDHMVNLAVFDRNGVCQSRQNVILVQEGDQSSELVSCCKWMPYQIGQAKRHEQTDPQPQKIRGV